MLLKARVDKRLQNFIANQNKRDAEEAEMAKAKAVVKAVAESSKSDKKPKVGDKKQRVD